VLMDPLLFDFNADPFFLNLRKGPVGTRVFLHGQPQFALWIQPLTDANLVRQLSRTHC